MKYAVVLDGEITNLVFSEEAPENGVLVSEENLEYLSGLIGYETYFPPPAPEPTLQEMLLRSASDSRNLSDGIIEKIKAQNLQYFLENSVPNEQAILISLWVHHRLRAIEFSPMPGMNVTIDLMNLVVSGDLETAYVAISNMAEDDMTQPYHYFSSDRISFIKSLVEEALGW